MLIDRVVAAYFETNCWIMATGAGQEAIIVDPGIGKPNLVKSIVEKVQEHNLKPVAVLITHGHLDHMFSVLPLTKEIPMRTYITSSDRFLLSDPMGALDRGGVSQQLISAFGSNFKEPDDVLLPVGGLLDILDSFAFIRTGGYLPSPNDVYVSLQQVRKYGLRKGDVITGSVREPKEGERREKFSALVKVETVNGNEPDTTKERVEFSKLVPLYPQDRLRLETEPNVLTTRIIDLISPIGKGQRGLIVSPPKAGKTMVLQAIANAITTNNPECHLMVVLVDERPEEVTDMQRSVKGEVIAFIAPIVFLSIQGI